MDDQQALFQSPFCSIGLVPLENSSLVTVNSIYLYFRRACFLTGWSSNIISKFNLCENKQMGLFATFDDRHGFPFGKISIWRLCKIHIFFSLERLVFVLDGRQTFFKAHFVSKQTKRKIPLFDLNHGLTPLKKIQTDDYKIIKSIF